MKVISIVQRLGESGRQLCPGPTSLPKPRGGAYATHSSPGANVVRVVRLGCGLVQRASGDWSGGCAAEADRPLAPVFVMGDVVSTKRMAGMAATRLDPIQENGPKESSPEGERRVGSRTAPDQKTSTGKLTRKRKTQKRSFPSNGPRLPANAMRGKQGYCDRASHFPRDYNWDSLCCHNADEKARCDGPAQEEARKKLACSGHGKYPACRGIPYICCA